jgi:hypothetical protein
MKQLNLALELVISVIYTLITNGMKVGEPLPVLMLECKNQV